MKIIIALLIVLYLAIGFGIAAAFRGLDPAQTKGEFIETVLLWPFGILRMILSR